MATESVTPPTPPDAVMTSLAYLLGYELGEDGQDSTLPERLLATIPDGWAKVDGEWRRVRLAERSDGTEYLRLI